MPTRHGKIRLRFKSRHDDTGIISASWALMRGAVEIGTVYLNPQRDNKTITVQLNLMEELWHGRGPDLATAFTNALASFAASIPLIEQLTEDAAA
jgi:hypothetical protein